MASDPRQWATRFAGSNASSVQSMALGGLRSGAPEACVPLVEFHSVVCLLGTFPALAGVDLQVEPRDIVLLEGPNGAGKTTLLRLIAGLIPPHSGEAQVFGLDLFKDRRSARRRLALVGHESYCYDDLTVMENLQFTFKASGVTGMEINSVLERTGLDGLAGVRHAHLSAGQRRRLALANAMVRNPELLLLDEPHAGLDEEGRACLHEIIASAPSEGRTVVLASHELELSRQLANREVRVESGTIVKSGRGEL